MKKMFWLFTGLTAGMILARKIEQNPTAKAVADDLIKSAKELGGAFMEGFDETHSAQATAKPAANASTKRTASRKPTAK
jgi:hypothetical protein